VPVTPQKSVRTGWVTRSTGSPGMGFERTARNRDELSWKLPRRALEFSLQKQVEIAERKFVVVD
jgi:hypothetical protein